MTITPLWQELACLAIIVGFFSLVAFSMWDEFTDLIAEAEREEVGVGDGSFSGVTPIPRGTTAAVVDTDTSPLGDAA